MPTGDWIAGSKVRPVSLSIAFDPANPGQIQGGLMFVYDVVLPSGQGIGQRSLQLPLTAAQKTALQNLVTAGLAKLNTDEGISQVVPAPPVGP